MGHAIAAAGAILFYLEETEHREIGHVSSLSRIDEDRFVWLDKFTIRNLELVSPQQVDGVSLLEVIDKTITPMGARMIKKWLVLPLKEKSAIEDRLSAVEALIENEVLREDLAVLLKPIGDIERLISKVAVGRINPREMNHLKRALKQLGPLSELLNSTDIKALNQLGDQINPCELLLKEIEDNLKDETPLVSNQGGLINDGIHSELDDLRKISFSGKDYLLQIQKREGELTGIQSLKIAYNKVFGYYLEVTNAHKDKVPEEWIRKQTLVNAERYITEELKTYEEKILNAEEKIIAIEQRLYLELVVKAAEYIEQIQQDARILARMDCLLSFAELAIKNKYARPTINDGSTVDIKEGRHPVN